MRNLVLCVLVVTALASSAVDSSAQHINLVGHRGGVPDPIGAFVIHTGIPFSTVRIDFSACPDICPASVQALGQVTDCSTRSVSKIADAVGDANMNIIGAAINGLANSGSCASVYVNNVFTQSLSVGAFDLDGVGGVNAADLARWQDDFISLANPSRSDYVAPFSNVGAADVAAWVSVYFCGTSSESGVLCCSAPPLTHVGGGQVNLAWDECAGGGGPSTKIFACNTNSGSVSMVTSVLAPAGATRVSAVDGAINFVSAAPLMPNWWSFGGKSMGTCDPVTGCRTSSVSASNDFTTFPGGCLDPWTGAGLAAMWTEYATDGKNGRFNVAVTAPANAPVDLSGGAETYAFRVNIDRQKTTGAGACVGCLETVCLYVSYMHLYQVNASNILTTIYNVTAPQANNMIFWQGTASVCATPTRNVTWGRIKTLYH